MKDIKPLFMWAGGKNKMIKNYIPYLPQNLKTYSEPFFGGGAMYIYVQQKYSPQTCYINDSNIGIINIYRSIQSDPAHFIDSLAQYEQEYLPLSKPLRKKMYYRVRHEHAYNFSEWSTIQEAATLYFLMKTGFNGIWQINRNTNDRFGTPSGLLNQKDELFDPKNIMAWNGLLQNTEILCGDWKLCPFSDFTFCDPPYRDSFTKYGTGWGDSEFEELIQISGQKAGTIFICNRDDGTDWIQKRSQGFSLQKFSITYTAGRRKKTENGFSAKPATEILLYR
jgi:DNA adenine methylase